MYNVTQAASTSCYIRLSYDAVQPILPETVHVELSGIEQAIHKQSIRCGKETYLVACYTTNYRCRLNEGYLDGSFRHGLFPSNVLQNRCLRIRELSTIDIERIVHREVFHILNEIA